MLYEFLISMRATFPVHLILLDLITLVIKGEEYTYDYPVNVLFFVRVDVLTF